MTVSFIVATAGRPSLKRTLQSIETRPGDEILIVGDALVSLPIDLIDVSKHRFLECPRGNDWGHSERNFAMPHARGNFLSFMDDDDLYAPGHRAAMEEAMARNPHGPTMFRMRLNHMGGMTLWQDMEVRCGNVGTPMFFVPNDPDKLGSWPPHYGGDCTFMQNCQWDPHEVLWSTHVIADVMGNSL